jgi:hypothetical protein
MRDGWREGSPCRIVQAGTGIFLQGLEMYEQIFSHPVKNGLIIGYRCPISQREFVACDPSKAQQEALRVDQLNFTRSLMEDLDGVKDTLQPRVTRSLAEYKALYNARQF